MISLVIPPKSQVAQATKLLAEEYGTASNIKSRVNRCVVPRMSCAVARKLADPTFLRHRLSVLSAITSTQQRLKLYSKIPPNGLVVYCGTVVTDDGKEKKLSISFEPFKPINTSLYLCDNKFHTEVRAPSHSMFSDAWRCSHNHACWGRCVCVRACVRACGSTRSA